ncbi:MAG: hypothetical protein P1U58_11825 [Verrucomicrobiales bacterium]|nr:hypothetical protein [Verrucomicrobiales bacterium]
MPKSQPSYFRTLWLASLSGVRVNFVPGIALWVIGILVVAVYYGVPDSAGVFDRIIDLKERYGYAFSAVSTATFGGLIPFICLLCSKRVPHGAALSWGLFFLIYWTVRGVEVDALYRAQALLFGDNAEWQTILTKVVVDQFVYCPIWSAPITAISYGWKDAGFSWKAYRPQLNRDFFLFQVPSVLLSIWIVWIPATAIIYALPLELQIPLFNLVLCFFVLLISVLDPESEEAIIR